MALSAFATHGYDGVSMRTLNRELGGSHNLLAGRFGSKEALWFATVDWAFEPFVRLLATAFDPTLSDPLEQLRRFIVVFLTHSAEHPELLGLMNIEGVQETARLTYVYDTYVEPGLRPVGRLLEYLAAQGRIHNVPLRTFHFLVAHGAGGPATLTPLAGRLSDVDPRDAKAARENAELCADLIIRGLHKHDTA